MEDSKNKFYYVTYAHRQKATHPESYKYYDKIISSNPLHWLFSKRKNNPGTEFWLINTTLLPDELTADEIHKLRLDMRP